MKITITEAKRLVQVHKIETEGMKTLTHIATAIREKAKNGETKLTYQLPFDHYHNGENAYTAVPNVLGKTVIGKVKEWGFIVDWTDRYDDEKGAFVVVTVKWD